MKAIVSEVKIHLVSIRNHPKVNQCKFNIYAMWD